jgi:anti-sigma regulatory factor (Ser/Thr protein kinase)
MNTVFKPSDFLLKEIDFTQYAPVILVIQTKNDTDSIMVPYTIHLTLVLSMLNEKYKERFGRKESNNLFIYLYSEPLRNAMEHGNNFDESKQVVVVLWFGEKGILLGFRDEGDFFTRETTKLKYENRQRNPSTRIGSISGGHGTIGLYSYAKSIYVDTYENTLYVSYLFN